MVRQRFTRVFLCLCLMLAGPAPWTFAVAAAADTNGDNAVDILDLQKAVAALLSPDAEGVLADVNGDKVVDILDVQRILNEASESSAPEPPQKNPAAPPAIPASSTDIAVLLPLALQQAGLVVEPQQPAARTLPVEEHCAPPPSTFRLVFGLSPHAPPSREARQPQLAKL